jgi:hypothetical protein
MDLIGLKYVFPSKALKLNHRAMERYGNYKIYSSNIVPKVDDNGNISGTYYLFNKNGFDHLPVKLKTGSEYRKSFE